MAPRGLFIPSGLDMKQARESMRLLREEAKKAGTAAGQALGAETVKGLKAEFNAKIGTFREALAKGMIRKEDFRKLSQEAAREFNTGILAALEKLRAAGKANTEEFTKLQRALKNVGDAGARGGNDGARGMGVLHKAALSLKNVFIGIGAAFTARALFGFLASSIREAEEASRAWSDLETSVENAGVSYEKVRRPIEAAAEAASRRTRFGDDDFAAGLARLVSITDSYSTAIQNMDLVLDVAARKHVDLDTAAQIVGLALEGNTKKLREFGISIKDPNKALDELREKTRGYADRDGKSLSGRLQQLRNEWGDIKEAIGEAVLGSDGATDSFGGLIDKLRDVEGWIKANSGALNGLVIALADATLATAKLLAKFGLLLNPVSAGAQQQLASTRAARRFGVDIEQQITEQEREVERRRKAVEEARRKVTAEATAAGERAAQGQAPGFGAIAAGSELIKANQQLEIQQRVLAELREELVATAAAQADLGTETGRTRIVTEEMIRAAEAARKKMAAARDDLNEQIALFRQLQSLGLKTENQVPKELLERLEEVVKLEKQIADTRKDAIAAGGIEDKETGLIKPGGLLDPATAEETNKAIVAQTAHVNKLKTEIGKLKTLSDELNKSGVGSGFFKSSATTFSKLGGELAKISKGAIPAVGALAKSLKPVQLHLELVEKAATKAAAAQNDLAQATLAGDTEGATKARKDLANAQELVKDRTAALTQALKDANLPSAEIEKILDAIVAALRDAGIDLPKATKGVTDFGRTLRTIETAARGLLSVTDFFDGISDSAKQSVTALLDVLSGIEQIQAAAKLAGIAKIAGIAGGAGAIAGGALQLGSALGLFGGNREEEKRRRAAAEALAKDLDRLHQSLQDLAADLGPFASAVRRAQDALIEIAERVGIKGVTGRESAISERERLRASLPELERQRREGDFVGRGLAEAQVKATIKRIEELNQALAEYDKAIQHQHETLEKEIAIRRIAAAGDAQGVERATLAAKNLAELNDAISAFGALDPIIADLQELHALETRRLEERLASETRVFELEAESIQARAAGNAAAAEQAELAARQEERLFALRQKGADAVTIAAQEQLDAEERARLIRDQEFTKAQQQASFLADLFERQAEAFARGGDVDAAQQKRVEAAETRARAQAAADIEAAEKLRDAGIITEEMFLSLAKVIGENLADAISHAADAAAEAARVFEESIELDFLRSQGRETEARTKEIEARRKTDIEEATRLGLGQQVVEWINAIADAELSKLGGDDFGGRAQGEAGLPAGQSEVVRQITALSETTGLTLVDIGRQGVALHREGNALLRQLVGGIRLPAASAFIPAGGSAARTTTAGTAPTIQQLGPFNVTVYSETGDAEAIVRQLTPRMIREIDRALYTQQSKARRTLGDSSLMGG